jgi:hypothetical protein
MRDGALRLTECTITAVTIAGLGVGAVAVIAQARFDVLGRDVVSGLNGMTVYTIRDNRLAQCYTLFVTDGGAGTPLPIAVPPPEPTREQLERIDTAQALRDLQAERDRRIRDLHNRPTFWVSDYAVARGEIDLDYEQAVNALLPQLWPPASVAPDWPTTSRPELDAAVNRAITEGEVAAAAIARAPLDDRLSALIEGAAARAQRVAVSGPSPCGAAHGRQ